MLGTAQNTENGNKHENEEVWWKKEKYSNEQFWCLDNKTLEII